MLIHHPLPKISGVSQHLSSIIHIELMFMVELVCVLMMDEIAVLQLKRVHTFKYRYVCTLCVASVKLAVARTTAMAAAAGDLWDPQTAHTYRDENNLTYDIYVYICTNLEAHKRCSF